jgi:hypothetical protein
MTLLKSFSLGALSIGLVLFAVAHPLGFEIIMGRLLGEFIGILLKLIPLLACIRIFQDLNIIPSLNFEDDRYGKYIFLMLILSLVYFVLTKSV